ncbi:MAG: hypothetical protein R3324_17015 [Halobacteriales archaeon]|nr:hypothetical protein [Halobacteriales archaeon]
MAFSSSTAPLSRSVLFGGLITFLILTGMIATMSLNGQSFRYLVYLLMFGYALAIIGMSIVGYAVIR